MFLFLIACYHWLISVEQKMNIKISVWRLAAQSLLSILIFSIIVPNNSHVVAALSAIPLWNVTVNITDAESCGLAKNNNLQNEVKFTGDTLKTCSVQLASSNGTAVFIRISQGAFMYAERKANIFECQMKYVSVRADKTCLFVSRHSKLKLFLQGDKANGSSIIISQMPGNASAPICQDDTRSKEQHTSRVSQTNHCQAYESDDLLICNLSPDYTCSFKFPGNCNVTLGNRVVEFHCLADSIRSSHKALIIYPSSILTLDLTRQSIVALNVNSFTTLNSLKSLLLAYNYLGVLPRRLLSGLQNLEYLTLRGNQLSSLDENIFNETKKLTRLILWKNRLKRLPGHLFYGLDNLNILSLTDNDLTILPKGLFTGLTNLEILYLSKNRINSLDEALFNETNKLTLLSLDENDLTILPKGLFTVLTNLEILYLSINQIISLDNNLFNKTIKLTELYLTDNNFTVLPEGLFMGMENLNRLSLSKNNINSLNEKLFDETIMLTSIDLTENDLTVLPKGLFLGMTNLKYLKLRRNNLKVLSKGLFLGLTSLKTLYLEGNKINLLDDDLFNETNRLYRLELADNDLTVLPTGLFSELKHLANLNLGTNQINSLHWNLFNEASALSTLQFNDNNLVQLSNNLFKGLSNLQSLYLNDNKMLNVNKDIFHDLINLRFLYLQNNRFTTLNFGLFQYTKLIVFLDLSGNRLNNIPDISNLRQLFYLNVKGNQMTGVTKLTFSYLPNQTKLITGQHEICECYVSKAIDCTALEERSPFLTCDRLLADRVLVVVMWLIGLNALGGNLFVLCRRQKTSNKNKTQTFLLRNLAMSDLLMGIYMLLIASADIYFGEYFPMQAETWRSGITCRIAGTVSIVSSETSVFFVTLISIDRFLSIKYHNSRRKLGKKSSTVAAIVLWIMALVLGIVPSSLAGKNYMFYDNSHVCIGLPLSKRQMYNTEESEIYKLVCVDEGRTCVFKYLPVVQTQNVGEVNGMIFASVMFLGLNFLCYLVILVCYIEIIRTFYKSSKRAGRNPEMEEQLRLISRVAAIVLTDFACWFPIIIIGFLVQVGVLTLPTDVFAWCVTFVLPINSAINPYLYTIAGVISERRKQTRANDLQHGSHQSNQRGRTPEVLNTSDLELGVNKN